MSYQEAGKKREMSTREIAYASLVAVGPQENWHKTGCVAWVDSRDGHKVCGAGKPTNHKALQPGAPADYA